MAQRTQLDDGSHPLHEAYACWPTAWTARQAKPCDYARRHAMSRSAMQG